VFPGTSDVLADLLSPHTSQTLYIEALVPQLALKGQTVAHVREALGALGAVFVGTRQRGVVSLNPADSMDIPMDAQIIYVSSRSLSGQVR
jgi:hypothetical protein